MKKYIAHVRQKSPHDRRLVAVRIAGIITAVIFVGWVATLGVRLGSTSQTVASEGANFTSQLASVFSAFSLPQGSGENTLEVAPSTE